MKYSVVASVIIGAASAVGIPRPRAQAQSCGPLSKSNVPVPDPNTPESFTKFQPYGTESASSATPSAFDVVFTNQTAAIRSYKYMHYVDLDKYEVTKCAASCNSSPGCDAFNIFFLRHPSVEPAATCPNPKANTVVRCTLFNQPLEAGEALNRGQGRGPPDANGQDFEVRIAGSNAYNRVAGLFQSISAGTIITVTQTRSCATAPSTVTVTQTVTAAKAKSTSTSVVSTAWPHTSTLTIARASPKTTQTTTTASTKTTGTTSTVSSTSTEAVSTAWPHTSTLTVAAAVHRAASATHKP
ncbi:hypothetical protein FB567DRAFT_89986 [Paraphoma chrysanthemicola]|uniref:Apple domain-containing protein n=1 Tax=Paraphoma chrysanthemicola TaxID=798071 RepID=A0A8K0R2P3_9PLEO|nr:hypothetical protein FB567DRAFT_89986 [Paraphoma chrysanthemicola]